MSKKSKPFRVAVEGATTDGRVIQRNWLLEAAETYNPELYGARINMEHIRSLNPDWGFKAYGDVLSLSTQTVEINGEKVLALYAEIEPNDELIKLNAAGQKIYSSIEIDPDFRGQGKCYFVGMAITDSPASIGTEMLKFARENPEASPFTARKLNPQNLFSSTALIEDLEFVDAVEPGEAVTETVKAGEKKSLLESIRAIFSRQAVERVETNDQLSELGDAVEQVASFSADLRDSFDKFNVAQAAELKKLSDRLDKFETQFNETVVHNARPVATGEPEVQAFTTDC